MSTDNGNIIIARFMGAKTIEPIGHMKRNIEFPMQVGGLYVHREQDLIFDSCWEWLMPVIEKISDYHYQNYFDSCPKSHEREPYEDCAYPRTFGMRDNEGNYMFRFNANQLFIEKTLIQAAYKAVVDFIIYYNEQQLLNQFNQSK